MSKIKDIIQQYMINPAMNNRGETHYKVAKIIKTYEDKNECSIEYIDKDRIFSNKDSVAVRIYNPYGDNWFPQKGDIVTIEEIDGTPVITGMPEELYSTKIRTAKQLEKDIHPDNVSTNTDGGYII